MSDLTLLPPYEAGNVPTNDSQNFYRTKELWTNSKDEIRSYNKDNSFRVFTTIITSGDKCRFFDKDGKCISLEEFNLKHSCNSGENFRVTMNKTNSNFIIKVSA
jgi:hypothetical protein